MTEKAFSSLVKNASPQFREAVQARLAVCESVDIPSSKRAKYGAIKTRVDGYLFDSKLEASTYESLCRLKQAGSIRNLEIHVKFPFEVNGTHVFTYEADFMFEERVDGAWVEKIVDTKAIETPVFKLKARCLSAAGVHLETWDKDGNVKKW